MNIRLLDIAEETHKLKYRPLGLKGKHIFIKELVNSGSRISEKKLNAVSTILIRSLTQR